MEEQHERLAAARRARKEGDIPEGAATVSTQQPEEVTLASEKNNDRLGGGKRRAAAGSDARGAAESPSEWESRPGAEAVGGIAPVEARWASTGTIIVGAGSEDSDDKVDSKVLTTPANRSMVLMEAQLVEDSAVNAVVVDNDEIEKDYKQRLRKDTSKVRKMFLIGGVLILIVVISIVVGTVVGLQSNSSDSAAASLGEKSVGCGVELSITCSSGGTDCADLEPPATCQGPPTFLTFIYNGNSCDSSSAIESPIVFECFDAIGGGPAATLQERIARIVVSEPGGNVVGNPTFVPFGQPIIFFNPLKVMVIQVTDPDSTNILQTMVLRTDCELLDLRLGDRFGSLELETLSFDETGGIGNMPRRFQTIKYTFEVTNTGSNSNTNATQFTWNANIGGTVASAEAQTLFVASIDETVVLEEMGFEIDLLFAQEYVVNGAVLATSESAECGDTAVHTFSGGLLEFPSQVPSAVPSSNLPSATPSFSANPTPSNPPQPAPTPISGDACFVTLTVECEPPLGFTDCNSMALPRTTCAGLPTSLTFRYNARNCSDSFNMQPPSSDSCTDFNGGPPSLVNQNAFVVASDLDNAAIVYFADWVLPSEDFTVAELIAGTGVPTNLNINVYPSSAQESPVQEFSFVASCSTELPLFLNDRFGSVQLILFTNNEQGVVDSIVDVNLVYTVLNGGSTLDSLTSINSFTPGFFNLTDQANEIQLENPNEIKVVAEQSAIIDLTRTNHTAFGTAQIRTPDGFSCGATDFLVFSVPPETHSM